MSDIQRLPLDIDANPVHPNAKTTTHVNNGTTTTKTNISSPVCRNCKTQTTPLWRRDETGQVLCNACGLFLKLHGRPRPISLKTDTIKSRNRIKQQPNNGSLAKLSTPNTPELKSKDSKPLAAKSPKMKKKTSEMLTPMFNKSGPSTSLLFTSPTNLFVLPLHHQLLPQHAQPLHYPSSTPTHFAPGLQRITSPLLLSTTSSISNTRNSAGSRSSNPVHAAAGALENMSNELGPSATFKSSKISTPMSLINSNPTTIKKENLPVFSTPSSALNASPKLASAKPISSPSFGPQFHLNNNSSASPYTTQASSETYLPPLQHVASVGKPSLPHFQNIAGGSASDKTPQSNNNSNSNTNNNNTPNPPGSGSGSGAGGSGAGGSGSGNSGAGGSGNSAPATDESLQINTLKTRISELELVNDLYRTRIMELEAMEQAARLRETSMRRRIDEIINLQRENEANKRMKVE